MAVPLDDAVPGKRRQFGVGVFDQFERSGRRADLGDGRANRRRQIGAPRDRALHLALPVATMSTRSASIRSGECSRTGSATEGWSSDSACTIAAGASALRAKTSAMAWRTSGDGSSSSISSAPSAAARSSSDKI